MIEELMAIRRNKLPFFQRGLRAMSLMIRTLWRRCHPLKGLSTIMIVAIAAAPYSTLSTPEKVVIARTYLFW